MGLVGLCTPRWQPLFLSLTPFNLLLSAALVFAFQKGDKSRFALFVILASVVGYLVELLGITTGWPFGEYYYGEALGPKILGVPPVIGLNWALLTYCSAIIASGFVSNRWARAFIGAGLMVGLDLLIEPMAPKLDFWHWQLGHAPFINFVGWYGCAVLLQLLFARLSTFQNNTVTGWYFVTVTLFFLLLNIFI